MGQAALSSGLAVATPGDASATGKAVVEIQTMWCTGYAVAFKADVTLGVMIVDPANNVVRVPAIPVHGDETEMNCRDAYRVALGKVYDQLVAQLASPNLRAAATAAGGAPPPPAPAQ